MSLMLVLARVGETAGGFHRPPLHPILVTFTAALAPASFVSDVLGRMLRRPSLTATGWWTLLYAAIVTPFTALAGWFWLRSMPPMDVPEMNAHKFLGVELAAALIVLVWWRWRIHSRSQPPGRSYLLSVGVVVVALVIQGYFGGTMSFCASDSPSASPQTKTHVPGNAATDSAALHWGEGVPIFCGNPLGGMMLPVILPGGRDGQGSPQAAVDTAIPAVAGIGAQGRG